MALEFREEVDDWGRVFEAVFCEIDFSDHPSLIERALPTPMNKDILSAVLLSLVPLVSCSEKKPADRVTDVATEDADMNEAIAKSRGLLPHFWETFEAPKHGENGFCLKVRISDESGIEHFWVTDLTRKDGKIFGTIQNEAEIVKSVKMGQLIEVPEADISDWLYQRGDKMVGNYTLRALYKTMPPDEAEGFRKMIVDP